MDEQVLDRQGPCLLPRVVRRLCLRGFDVIHTPYWIFSFGAGQLVSPTGTNVEILTWRAAENQHAPMHKI